MTTTQLAPALKQAAAQADVATLCRGMFGYDLAPFQEDIVREVAYGHNNRVAITAPTQTGKSLAVSIGVALLITAHPGPLVVSLVAPKREQAKKIRTYFGGHVANSQLLAGQLQDAQTGTTAEKLQNEASKERVTFENGKEFTSHTAGGSLMSQGCDVLILDESGEMTEEQHAEARRMAAGSVDEGEWTGREINIGNPWPDSPFQDVWQDDDYTTYRTTWQQAVEQGRAAREFVEKERERLDNLRFTVYYESRFPESAENALYEGRWIQHAVHRDPFTIDNPERRWSLDVAEGGTDQNVLAQGALGETKMLTSHGEQRVEVLNADIVEVWDEADTSKTTRKVRNLVPDGANITVDSLGVGKGVADNLANPDDPDAPTYEVNKFKASHEANDSDFYNRFMELAYADLRDMLEEGRVSLPDHDRLQSELRRARRDLSKKKIRVEFEGKKSPDCADAVIMLLDDRVGPSSISEPTPYEVL